MRIKAIKKTETQQLQSTYCPPPPSLMSGCARAFSPALSAQMVFQGCADGNISTVRDQALIYAVKFPPSYPWHHVLL